MPKDKKRRSSSSPKAKAKRDEHPLDTVFRSLVEETTDSALRRLWQGKATVFQYCPGYTPQDDDPKIVLGFWILLATRCVEKLAAQPEDYITVLASWCYRLSACCRPTEDWRKPFPRQIFCRARLAAALGASVVLNHLDGEDEYRSMLSAVLTLDRTVVKGAVFSSTKGPTQAQDDLWEQAEKGLRPVVDEHSLASFGEVDGLEDAVWDKELQACLDNLVATFMQTPNKKKKKVATNCDALVAAFQSAIPFHRTVDYACQRAVQVALYERRFCLFENMILLLNGTSTDASWQFSMKTTKEKAKNASPKTNRKRKSSSASVVTVDIPDNVVSILLTSRLVRVVAFVVGNRRDDELLEKYIENEGWKLGDVSHHDPRDLTAFILDKLVQTHSACIASNCAGYHVVNDNDETSPALLLPCLFPYVSSLLDRLIETVCMPLCGLSGRRDGNEVTARLEALATSFVFMAMRENDVVDAKLLTTCLRWINTANAKSPVSKSSVPRLAALMQASLPNSPLCCSDEILSNNATYAGAFRKPIPWSADGIWVLVLRAMGTGIFDARVAKLIQLCLSVAEVVLSTQNMLFPSAQVVGSNDAEGHNRLTNARVSCLCELFDIISHTLRSPSNTESSVLQKRLRQCWTTADIHKLLLLEISLYRLVPHANPLQDSHNIKLESKVWEKQMSMYICLGRGDILITAKTSVGFNPEERLALFHSAVELQRQDDSQGLFWPLCLNPGARLVVASVICSIDGVNELTYGPEEFIVESAINSIQKQLSELDDLVDTTVAANVVTNMTPLSLEDSRVILAAYSLLPEQKMEEALRSLVTAVSTWISSVQGQQISLFSGSEQALAFLARLTTFCSCAYSVLRFGKNYRDELLKTLETCQSVGRLNFQPPRRNSASNSFSSVLEVWEFADEASCDIDLGTVDITVERNIHHLLDWFFELGLNSSFVDGGHLLFAAWNGLGKSDLWAPTKSISPFSDLCLGDAPKLLLELRNEVCFVHRLLCRARHRSLPSKSLILKATEQFNPIASESSRDIEIDVASCLRAMAQKGVRMLEQLLDELSSDNASEIASSAFSLLRLIPVYLTFALAGMTQPADDYFTFIRKSVVQVSSERGRSSSTDSENVAEVHENNTSDSTLDAYKHVVSVCGRLEAVPYHPDWLDTRCHLLKGLTHRLVTDLAESVLSALNRLSMISFHNAFKWHSETLKTFDDGLDDPSRNAVISLLWMKEFMDLETIGEGGRLAQELFDSIACLVRGDPNVLATLVGIAQYREANCIESSVWSRRAAQRVQGRLHDLFRGCHLGGEQFSAQDLRASDEWEILLARAICPVEMDGYSGSAGEICLLKSKQWMTTMKACIESVAPVTALLWMGTNKRCRSEHPSCRYGRSQADAVFTQFRQENEAQEPGASSARLKQSIHSTLGCVASSPLCGSNFGFALNLVKEESSCSNLRSIYCVRTMLSALPTLLKNSRVRSNPIALNLILEKLADYLSSLSSGDLIEVALGSLPPKNVASYWCDLKLTSQSLRDSLANFVVDNDLCVIVTGWIQAALQISDGRVVSGSVSSDLITILRKCVERDSSTSRSPLREDFGFLRNCSLVLQSIDKDVLATALKVKISLSEESDHEKFFQSLLTILLLCAVPPGDGTNSSNVVEALVTTCEVWVPNLSESNRARAVLAILSHAARTDSVQSVCTQVLDVASNHGRDLETECLSWMCKFASLLSTPSTKKQTRLPAVAVKNSMLASLPTTCTYVRHSDFNEQHWYQCYTCGLTGERGCCSLCALVCHAGHDVSYARFSSFFCDCGAEQKAPGATSKCHCLREFSEKELCDVVERCDPDVGNTSEEGQSLAWCWPPIHSKFKPMRQSLGVAAIRAVESLLDIFRRRDACTLLLQSIGALESEISYNFETLVESTHQQVSVSPSTSLRASLVKKDCLYAISDGSVGVVNHSHCGDSIIDSSVEGILAIAERTKVLFCNGIASVCRPVALQTLGDRTDLFPLQTVGLPFEPVGIRFCPIKPRIVVAWGVTEACAINLDSIQAESCIEELVSGSQVAIQMCDWLPGSVCLLFLCQGSSLTLFNAACCDGQVASFKCEDVILSCCSKKIDLEVKGVRNLWRIFVLLEGGTMNEMFLMEQDGCGYSFVNARESSVIPESSKRFLAGTLDSGSVSSLCFLEQCNLIIADCEDSAKCVVLDDFGTPVESFALLPPSVKVVKGKGGARLYGPYSHWKSLGMVERDSLILHRLMCIASGTKKENVLALVEFGALETSVQMLDIGDTEQQKSIIDFSVLSVPFPSDTNPENLSFEETRHVFCLGSSGSLRVFKDSSCLPLSPDVDSLGACVSASVKAPLLAYESLTNCTEQVEVLLEADEDYSAKERLTREDMSLTSTSKGSFVFSIRVPAENYPDLIVVSVRVLVGSSSAGSIPTLLSMLGQTIIPEQNVRKWYNFHVGHAQVALVMRLGILSVLVGPAYSETDAPHIDSLQVYGRDESEVLSWLPTSFTRLAFYTNDHQERYLAKSLTGLSAIEALTSICHIDESLSSENMLEALRAVFQQAIVYGSASVSRIFQELVAALIPSSTQRLKFIDRSAVAGFSCFIESYSAALASTEDTLKRKQISVALNPKLRACLRKSSRMVQTHPQRYVEALEQDSIAMKSMAVFRICIESQMEPETIADLTDLCLLEVAAIRSFGSNVDTRERFASFELIQEILLLRQENLVSVACNSVVSFCSKYVSPVKLKRSDVDYFAAQPMVVAYGCDGCGVCPIEGTRFNFDDEGESIDLCEICFNTANRFAAARHHDEEIVVNGKKLGKTYTMTCGNVQTMSRYPLPEKSDDHTDRSSSGARRFERQQLFDAFLDELCDMIHSLLVNVSTGRNISSYGIVSLLYGTASLTEKRNDRIPRLARKLVENLSACLSTVTENDDPSQSTLEQVEMLSNTLASLILPDQDGQLCVIDSKAMERAIATTCEDAPECYHRLPAVLKQRGHRRCYVCGVDSKAHRCDFFVWDTLNLHSVNAATQVWACMSQTSGKENGKTCAEQVLSLLSDLSTSHLIPNDVEEEWPWNGVQSPDTNPNNQKTIRCSIASLHGCFAAVREPLDHERLPNVGLATRVLESLLRLIALISSDGKAVERWYKVLLGCEHNRPWTRALSRRALWQICGKNPQVYLSARDRYQLAVDFDDLRAAVSSLMINCALIKRKSHCFSNPGSCEVVEESGKDTMSLLHMVGCVDLISEDETSGVWEKDVASHLNSILKVAQKRPVNWSDFSHQVDTGCKAPPLFELLQLTCVLPRHLQALSIRLASLAFGSSKQKMSSLGDFLKAKDVIQFGLRFVCCEDDGDIRLLSGKIVAGLCECLECTDEVLESLLDGPQGELSDRGKLYSDYFTCLRGLVTGKLSQHLYLPTALQVETWLYEQYFAASCTRSNDCSFQFETRSSASTQRSRFDLTKCAHVVAKPGEGRSGTKGIRFWEQVNSPSKTRIGHRSQLCANNEFNTFIALSHRYIVSEIQVHISEPRGRFVKVINIYTSPRQVENVSELKDSTYGSKWQKRGTIELERGMEKCSCVLKQPVLAANIRFEFLDFYSRPGSSPSDGFVVHCPRCTRVVTNEHGVCGNCGEVCWQCRQCRTINYDRLDAFLCVECGYCASGSFSYEIMGSIASNAATITCDKDMKAAMNMFSVSAHIVEDVTEVLRQKLQSLSDDVSTTPRLPHLVIDSKLMATDIMDEKVLSILQRFSKRGAIVKAIAQHRRNDPGAQSHDGNILNRLSEEDDNNEAHDVLGGLLERAGVSRDSNDPVSRLIAQVHRQRERRARRSSTSKPPITDSSKSPLELTLDQCEKLHRVLHEAQRECFALERRMDAWRRLERGDLTIKLQKPFAPSTCSHCAVAVAHQMLLLWRSLLVSSPSTVPVHKKLIMLLLSHDHASNRMLQELKRETARDVAVVSEQGRELLYASLKLRLVEMQDVHCAEILGMILKDAKMDTATKQRFVSLAEEGLRLM